MKKILLCAVLLTFVIASCKKKQNNPSITVTASYPTITFSGTTFFSIPVNGLRPSVTDIGVTAYDSFYKEVCPIVLIDTTINNLVAGLYIGQASAKNHYGYVSYANYYVAVTNIPASMDLSGKWILNSSSSTIIAKLATGLYSTSNVDGVPDSTAITTGYFAVTSDTTIVFSNGNPGVLSLTPIAGDTTISYTNSLGAPVTFSK